MPTNFITLSRTALYELVWTKPVSELAKEFGISDVALAKRCRAINIPLPPRGYWARVAAGQKPRRPALPPFGSERPRGHSDTTAKPIPGAATAARAALARSGAASARSLPSYVTNRDAEGEPTPEPTVTFDPDRTGQTPAIDEADLPAVGIPATTNLADACDLVKRTARHYKHPRRAELKFSRGEAHGPILHLALSPDTLDRALLFADTFLKAAAELTWSPIPPPEPEPPDPRHYYGRPPEPKPNPGPRYVDLVVDGHRIEFSIEERFTLKELPPTAADLAKQKRDSWHRPQRRTETIWSGRLRLKRPSHRYPYGIDGKSWFETANRRIESLIPKILADFLAVAARMQEVDEQREREELERERQQALREALAARRATNQTLIHELERQAGAWSRARLLRRYLRAARRATAPNGFFLESGEQPIDFLAWAEHYVNQLDPLHPEPHDPDLKYDRSGYSYGEDEKRPMQELRRLTGHSWESTTKPLSATTEVDEDSDDDDD